MTLDSPAKYVAPSACAATPSQITSLIATFVSYEGLFGPCGLQTLVVQAALAVALCEMGERDKGLSLLRRAVLDLEKHHGRYHPAHLRALAQWSDLMRPAAQC